MTFESRADSDRIIGAIPRNVAAMRTILERFFERDEVPPMIDDERKKAVRVLRRAVTAKNYPSASKATINVLIR